MTDIKPSRRTGACLEGLQNQLGHLHKTIGRLVKLQQELEGEQRDRLLEASESE